MTSLHIIVSCLLIIVSCLLIWTSIRATILLRTKGELQTKLARVTANIQACTVQHCNSKTDYELIVHIFNPDGCVHCHELRKLAKIINQ